MRKCLLLFILTTFTQVVFAQFLDNFSDGEFTNNPIWSGSVGVFEVDSTFKLHLNDTISGESFLATDNICWFLVNLGQLKALNKLWF